MPRTIYCWRCRMDLPMLTEDEWALVCPHLGDGIKQIQRYRAEHHCSLAEAQAARFGQRALALYEQLTGFKETNPIALFHHRLSMYGPSCHACGKPLRMPQARCIACDNLTVVKDGVFECVVCGAGLPAEYNVQGQGQS